MADLGRPAQKESKIGIGNVVLVLFLRGGWFMRIFSKRIEREVQHYRTCRICFHFKGWLIYADWLRKNQREVGHAVFVLILRGGWYRKIFSKSNRREVQDMQYLFLFY